MRKLLREISIRSKSDPLLSQALARTIFSFLSLLTFFAFDHYFTQSYTAAMTVAGIHLCYAVFIVFVEYRHPQDSALRKYIGIFADLGALSAIVALSDMRAVFIYPVFLWVVVGNGMRYGPKYLKAAMGIGVVFFTAATWWNPVWQMHRELAVSLSAGIVILGLFYGTLIQKIYRLNSQLEAKVRERTRQLEYQLYHDDLTQLKNRYALKSECAKEQCSELFLIDIDNFKQYNELYGMETGNRILKAVADTLRDVASQMQGEAYRIYSDGFALKFFNPDGVNEESCNLYIVSILSALTNFRVQIAQRSDEIQIDFTVVAVYEHERILEKADMALEYARKTGQKYYVYDASIDRQEEIEQNFYWKDEIRKAIDQQRIVPVFQPIVDKNGNVCKFESLIRLKQDGRLVTPWHFLDIAIKTRQYEYLTAIMIDKSFRVMQDRHEEFSINLSLSDISNKLTVNHLLAKIEKHKVANRLIIEILETEDSQDFDYVQRFVEKVRRLGVRIAIDDFGSGYSNFDHLFRLQPDYLKIDGSLIKRIDEDENAYKLVESIVFLAKNMGIETVAEYVHSKEVYTVCRELGIDAFQGFYLYEPMTMEQMRTFKQHDLFEQTTVP